MPKQIVLRQQYVVPNNLWAGVLPALKSMNPDALSSVFRSVQPNGEPCRELTQLLQKLVSHDTRLDTATLSPQKKEKRRAPFSPIQHSLKEKERKERQQEAAIIAIVRAVLQRGPNGAIVIDPKKGKANHSLHAFV